MDFTCVEKRGLKKFFRQQGQILNEAQPTEIEKIKCISRISFSHTQGFGFNLTINGNVGYKQLTYLWRCFCSSDF